jgi:hypothetical protein
MTSGRFMHDEWSVQRLLVLSATALIISACGASQPGAPTAPTVPPSTGDIPVTGSSQLGWDQTLSDSQELERLRFAVYVDDSLTRMDLPAASCAQPSSSQAVVSCVSPLPALIPGRHTLAMVAYDVENGLESGRSNALTVVFSSP